MPVLVPVLRVEARQLRSLVRVLCFQEWGKFLRREGKTDFLVILDLGDTVLRRSSTGLVIGLVFTHRHHASVLKPMSRECASRDPGTEVAE